MTNYQYDLHLHSYYSDGADSPEQIIEMAHERGLKAISITDHDTFTCTPERIAYAAALGIELFPGIEMSCEDETTGRKVHLLAYHLGDDHPHVDALINRFKANAMSQRIKMLGALQEMGINIQMKDIEPLMHGMLYKQHIALALEKLGYGPYTDLFPYYFRGENSLEKRYPTKFTMIKDAIEAVLLDGGIPVLAHPRTYRTFDQIEKYIGWGLKGIEISHPSYREGDLEKVIHYPLLHTGGSDYHGKYNLSPKRQIGNYGIEENDYLILKEAKKK